MKILLTGGTGLLGKELIKIDDSIITPTHQELDITNIDNIRDQIEWVRPNIIIHAAAICNSEKVIKYPTKVIETNIIGTSNIAICCIKYKIRLCFISTDYVYKGDKGNYSEDDEILPFNFYAWTKLGGECAVKGVKNHLIIRTTFGDSKFPYKEAYTNAWRSKDYIDVITPMIYDASVSTLQGVINIGTSKKTIYDYAKQRNPDVKPALLSNTNINSAKDTSFNLTKWNNFKNGNL